MLFLVAVALFLAKYYLLAFLCTFWWVCTSLQKPHPQKLPPK